MSRRPQSAAEAKRIMKAEAARLAALDAPAPPPEEPYERILEAYTPRAVTPERCQVLSPVVQDLMRRSDVRGMKVFRQLVSELTLYLDWVHTKGQPLTLAATMRHDLIEQWVAQKGQGGRDSTWGNRRSRLRNLASQVNPGPAAPKRAEPFNRAVIKEPYNRRQVADLERLALNQPTPTMKRHLCAMIGLGLGAGLNSTDLRELRACHVIIDPDAQMWIEVPGKCPRRVPVRDRYVRFVEAGLVGLRGDDLVLGRKVGRNNITGNIVAQAAVGATNVVPDQARLRATWLLALMTAPVPLADLLAAAGMTTARTIADLLRFSVDPEYVATTGAGDQ